MTLMRPESASSAARALRAFPETVDPASYVARDATENVLAGIERWAARDDEGSTVAAILARPGLGKTLLLRIIEARLDYASTAPNTTRSFRPSQRVLFLPYGGLSIIDLCQWTHGLLHRSITQPEASNRPEAALAAMFSLAKDSEEPFVLLIDDADSMPAETTRILVQGLPRRHSPLRLLMALNHDARGSRLLAALDPLGPSVMPVQEEMSETETARYIRARVEWARLDPRQSALFDSEVIGRIYALSGGVPRKVHMIAASILAADGKAVPRELSQKEQRENWLGQPIEDEF